MSDSPETAQPKPATVRRRWLGRWLIKLAGWFVALSFSALLIGGLVAVIAWHNLTGLANLAVSRFAQPYRVDFGRVEVAERGLIRLEQVRVRPPRALAGPNDEPWVTLAGADLAYDFTELHREGRFRSIVLRGPAVRIDDASLETLGLVEGPKKPGGKAGPKAPPFDLKRLGRITDRIEVVGGSWVVDTSRGPRVEGTWDVTVPPIDFGSADWLNLEPFAIRLNDLRFGRDGEGGTIDRIAVTGRVRSDLRGLEIGEFAIDAPKLVVTPDWLPQRPLPADPAPAAGTPESTEDEGDRPFEVVVNALSLRDAEVRVRGFQDGKGGWAFPDSRLQTGISWRGLHWDGQRLKTDEPLALAFSGLRVGEATEGRAPLAEVEGIEIRFDPAKLVALGRLESIRLTAPRLNLTPESTREIRELVGGTRAPDGAGQKAPAPWEIGAVSLTDGRLSAAGWDWEDRPLPALSFGLTAELKELSAGGLETEGAPESATQSIQLSELRIEGREPAQPVASVDRLVAEFALPDLLKRRRLARLAIERPALMVTDVTLPEWLGTWQPAGADTLATADEPALPWAADDLSVTGGTLKLDAKAFGGRLPDLQGDFSLAALPTEGAEPVDSLQRPLRLRFERLRVRDRGQTPATGIAEPAEKPATEVPPPPVPERLGGLFPQDPPVAKAEPEGVPSGQRGSIAEQDVAMLRELSIDFTPQGVQRDRRIERIEVKGGEFQVGDALQRLVTGDEAAPAPVQAPAPPPPAAEPAPQAAAGAPPKVDGWRVGEVSITETQVRFQALIPQIEGLEFGIETKLLDVPLNQEGILAQDQRQKIEIAGIEIRDPYDSFITVAFLPTIFVEFSLAGLVNQRIEKIDLLHPAIHVGQGLFWWIDYQRNYRKQNEGVAIGGAAAEAAGVGGGASDWVIDEINAHFGKIVIAPAGQPLGIVPFPFSASTNLNKGEIALKLQIPKEQQYVYQFPDFELDLYGLKGDIEFNVPVKQQDNNLVQTFTLDRAVWKQHEAQDLYLSVTYDAKGVYGRFGGSAYGGYAEGQFNAYLEDLGRWDAWIAGTNMNMGPITGALTPENFLMEGKVNAKLVSQGKGLLFGETTGEVRALSPGRIHVTKLDDVIADLPEGWSQLKKSTTRLSLDTLKEFAYDTGQADLYFLNQDGWLRLDLEGPSGSRRFEVHAHDWRKGGESAGSGAVSDSVPAAEPEPLAGDPEAGAPPVPVVASGGKPVRPRVGPLRGRR